MRALQEFNAWFSSEANGQAQTNTKQLNSFKNLFLVEKFIDLVDTNDVMIYIDTLGDNFIYITKLELHIKAINMQ